MILPLTQKATKMLNMNFDTISFNVYPKNDKMSWGNYGTPVMVKLIFLKTK